MYYDRHRSTVLAAGILRTEKTMLRIEIGQETGGRWLAEIAEPPGVTVYGRDPQEARRKVEALAIPVLAGRM